MELSGWMFWLGAAAVVLIMVLVFRKSGFRASAEAFGAKVELEGKGGAGGADAPAPAVPTSTTPRAGPASARADRGSIAVGGDATGTFVAGERNKVGPSGG